MNFVDLKDSDFFQFFGIHEVSSTKLSMGREVKVLKPGGFQESVDLQMTVFADGSIENTTLSVERKWMGNLVHVNPFATDIMKSFFRQFGKMEENPDLEEIANHIEHLHGANDKVMYVTGKTPNLTPLPDELQGAIALIFGAKNWEYEGSGVKVIMENQIIKELDWVVIKIEQTSV